RECDAPRRVGNVGRGGDADRPRRGTGPGTGGGPGTRPRIGAGARAIVGASPADQLVERKDNRCRPGLGVGGVRGALADGAVLLDEDGEYLRATDVDASGQHDPPSIEAADRVPSEVPLPGPPWDPQVSPQG